MLFISPPFGNYLSLPQTVSIAGSFTNEPRDGLLLQILKTLRYSFKDRGWINKIGLRNKGIDWAIEHVPKNKIISVAILDEKEIPLLLKKIPNDRNIELNISCPNAEKEMVRKNLTYFINPTRKWCIIKISPHTSKDEIDNFYRMGFRQFHCCNTLPVTHGGLSGPVLIPYTVEKVKYLSEKYPDCDIIAGGGIQAMNTMQEYLKTGAHHTSISTLLFHPLRFSKFYYQFLLQNPSPKNAADIKPSNIPK